jgi:hypothetical protein
MSLWVPNKFSSIIIFFSTKSAVHNSDDLDLGFDVLINGISLYWKQLWINCTHVFHLNLNYARHIQNTDQQIHVELKVERCETWRPRKDEVMKSVIVEMGVHVVREKNILGDNSSLIFIENYINHESMSTFIVNNLLS